MADNYIDYFEVSEYGNHFVSQVAQLVGASPLVDIEVLRARVGQAIGTVEAELQKAGITRTGVRGERGAATEQTTKLRELIERFYFHLRSLPSTAVFDFESFFPKRNLGNLSKMKPADILAQGAKVLRGFASNTGLADGARWQADLTAAHQALAAALDGKGGAKTESAQSTTALQAAREEFVKVYNQIAKRLVRGVLIDIGRERDFRLYFLDLQVNEGSNTSDPEPDPDGTPGPDGSAGPNTGSSSGSGSGSGSSAPA